MNESKRKHSLNKLLAWCEGVNYEGIDPYDIFEKVPFVLKLSKHKSQLKFHEKVIIYSFSKLNTKFPFFLRKLFRAEPRSHATAMACFFETYLLLYKEKGDEHYLEKANIMRKWLLENNLKNYESYCWGTPFDWQSGKTKYERGTPFAVVTCWVGQAFLRSYAITKNQADLNVCSKIADFLINDLKKTIFEDGTICFCYSDIKVDYINNANLFVASFLAEISSYLPDLDYASIAEKAAKYSINQQFDNGLIPYYGKDSELYNSFNDSYHSSYEIRSLLKIHQHTGLKSAKDAALKYYAYCSKTYFREDGSVRLSTKKMKVVDATSLAEFMILLGQFPELDTSNFNDRLTNYTIDKFQDPKGYFYYRISNKKTIKAPYIRWVQGWMALGLSTNLSHEKKH